jgi:membrane associated rhomboid family serine protease
MLSRLPQITRWLLVANLVAFAAQWLLAGPILSLLQLWPLQLGDAPPARGTFLPWQLFTYAFLHGDLLHLAFNMLALVMFGPQLEHAWGSRRFLAYYTVCAVGAGLCQLAIASWTVAQGGDAYPTVGASGGVFGLLLGYGLMFPHQRVMLLIPPIPMSARTLAIVYGVIALLLGLTGLQPGVAHFAHLGGMLFGWLLILYWRRRPPGSAPPKKRSSHLRIVK